MIDIEILDNSVPKYKKESKGSGLPKSKHKHTYKECLLHSYEKNGLELICKGHYCTVCGKIKNVIPFESVSTGPRSSKTLTNEEMIDKYKNLPMFTVDNMWFTKFVTLIE